MDTQDLIRHIGREKNTTTIGAVSAVRLTNFAASSTSDRKAVRITNTDTAAYLLVKVNEDASSGPTITTTDYHTCIPPRGSDTLSIARDIEVWAIVDSGSNKTATAVELR
jgi:hypothetical protein